MDKLKRVVIKEEYVALTGDYRAAIILNQFIYWSERVYDFDKFIDEENKRIEKFTPDDVKTEKTKGWIYKTADDLISECMLTTATKDNKKGIIKKGCISRTTILNYIDLLIENNWIEKRNNPKYKWDKTLQYRVNLIKIAIDLYDIGYILQEYSLPKEFYDHIKQINTESTKLNNRDSENENQNSVIENQNSENENHNSNTGEQYHRLPTETTPQTTSERDSFSPSNNLDKFFNSIKSEMTEASFKTWIEPLEIKQEENKIQVVTASDFTKTMIKNKFIEIIEIHLKKYFKFEHIEVVSAEKLKEG